MRTLSLLLVLLLAKALTIAKYEVPLSTWVIPALLWQDLLIALSFAIVDRVTRRQPAIAWGIYGLIVAYAAINVPIARLFSTPLTWPMLRATRATLADSIVYHVTAGTLLLVASVIVAGAIAPCILARLKLRITPPWRWAAVTLSLLVVACGPVATAHVELPAAGGNAAFVLVASALPLVKAHEAQEEWGTSPFGGTASDDLSQFRAAAKGRNLVIIHLESTGARYLRPYGAAEDPMPTLSELSRRAILFENAYASYPETIKSFMAVHCSTYPALDMKEEDYEHVASPALAAQLRQVGYQTGLFHSGRFMYLGMDRALRNRGFGTLEDAGDIGGNRQSSFGIDESSAVRRMLGWLDSLSPDRPFFLTYLPIAGHHPYETPDGGPFPEIHEIDRYRNALHDADKAVAALLEGLKSRGFDRNTLIVIFGDHGEAFDQHAGNFGHTLFLYEENVRIPFLIVAPGLIDEPIRVKRVVSQIDTAPTVLDLMGLRAPDAYQGRSLLDPELRMALFCTDYSQGYVGLRDGRWKLIYNLNTRRSKLFDLDADPDEKVDLAMQFTDQVATYRRHLLRWSAAQKFLIARKSR